MRWARDETVDGRLRELRGSVDVARRRALVDALAADRVDPARIVAAIARTPAGEDPWRSIDAEDVTQLFMHRFDLQRAATVLATRHSEVEDPCMRALCVSAAGVL